MRKRPVQEIGPPAVDEATRWDCAELLSHGQIRVFLRSFRCVWQRCWKWLAASHSITFST